MSKQLLNTTPSHTLLLLNVHPKPDMSMENDDLTLLNEEQIGSSIYSERSRSM